MKKLLVSIVAILSLHLAGHCSNKKDTIPVSKVVSYRFNYDFTAIDSVPIDTFLRLFQVYNPVFANHGYNNYLGNLTSPFQSSLYSDRTPFKDFVFSQYIDYNEHLPNSKLYFSARHPYTIITYFANIPGMKDEQKLNIVHTQNVNRNLNLGAVFDLTNSIGKYTNQQNTSNAITLFSSYHGSRYSIHGNINFNTVNLRENGGIQFDTAYENPNRNANDPLKVQLTTAHTTLRDMSFSIFHRYYITGSYKVDSLRESSNWNEAVSLIHQFTYNRITRSYNDDLTGNDSSYYFNKFKYNAPQKVGFNRDTTIDSIYFRRIENVVQIAVNANQWLKVPAELRFGIKNQIDKISTYSFDSTLILRDTLGVDRAHIRKFANTTSPDYQNSIINSAFVGSLTNRFSKHTSWGASGEYYFTGFKRGDLLLMGDISQSIKNNFIMHLSGSIATTRPGYFLQYYNSNHFTWHEPLSQQQSSSIKLGLYHLKRKFFIDARWDNFNNYVYFDSIAKPKTASNAFLVYSITVSKLIDWGIFHSNIRLTYQKSENEKAISIPRLSGFTSTYLAFSLFSKELFLQLGFDFYINSKYYANSYSPATSVFYAQDKKQIGNYPYTDMFLNMKLKRTRFFFKYEHIDGFAPNNYSYFIPHYPVNPPLLKFGISWTFYD